MTLTDGTIKPIDRSTMTEPLERALNSGDEKRLLRGVEAEQVRLADAGPPGDGVSAGAVETARGELDESCLQDVFATLYHNLGIDIANTALVDEFNRPHYLYQDHEPLPELI